MCVRPPPGLPELVAIYEGRRQAAVHFRPTTWDGAIADPRLTARLHDDRYTSICSDSRSAHFDCRTVDRGGVRAACRDMDLGDQDSVLSTLMLVMAWGSGTSSRGPRNAAHATRNRETAHSILSQTARHLRESSALDDLSIGQAHRLFVLPGIRQAYFTKWFSFAGHVPGRTWQPLILDSRVLTTLNQTLGVTTTEMARTRLRAKRYTAYVDCMHQWSDALACEGAAINSARLEWILFDHNGRPLRPG